MTTTGAATFTDGDAYERMMGRWSRTAGAVFLDWLAPPAGRDWLDCGCGNGAFTEEIVARCAAKSITAVDPSEGQLAFARTRPAARHASFKLGSAEALDFPDNSFDVSIMALVLAFLSDPTKAAAELARVTRPGGSVASYMWDIDAGGSPLAPMTRAMQAVGVAPAKRPSEAASRRDVMQELWQQAGMVDVETMTIPVEISYPSVDAFCDVYFLPIGPQGVAISKLSDDDRARLRRQLHDDLSGPGGRVSYKAFANAVKGRVTG
ncbi:class I SAM-dependent methyltransferase [Rhodopseudomonas sp. B29]|uniref:class I SAM-dependent methyltransferase n=1 Tax=Rhodopseudomonas sp. B29 TaxID=95607 RepID=UPI00034B021D|nr:class I SAM-dependent methyltransferase [Rhodopseudomonas sp. B29]